MPIRIAAISDLHFDPACVELEPGRRNDVADAIFAEAVRLLNATVRPDIVVLLGDLADSGRSDARVHLARIHAISKTLGAPVVAVPGNHDLPPDIFYSVFERPPDMVDVGGVRFLPFVDRYEPEFNARRMPPELARMERARSGFSGPIVSLQHVPLFPPGASDCPYNYVNAEEVITIMRRNRIGVAISGHYHPGMQTYADGLHFIGVPALSKEPFALCVTTLDWAGQETMGSVLIAWHSIMLAL